MQQTHSPLLLVYVAVVVVYVTVVLFVYVRMALAAHRRRNRSKEILTTASQRKIIPNPENTGFLAITIISIFVLTRWIVEQLLIGCMIISWWNNTCYDLGQLNRGWLAVVVVFTFNVVMLYFIYDSRQHAKKQLDEHNDK